MMLLLEFAGFDGKWWSPHFSSEFRTISSLGPPVLSDLSRVNHPLCANFRYLGIGFTAIMAAASHTFARVSDARQLELV